MIVFPNCKINLGLHVVSKREDGFHNLETVFYPLPLTDALEVIESNSGKPGVEFTASGLPMDGQPEENICVKAYQLLQRDYDLPPIKMHLHKTIPLGAGLGGGSSDGAFTLKLLNDKFHLGINEQSLSAYALALGSDCPFFLLNKPALATGRGEILDPLPLDLSAYSTAIINPGIHINTGWAFQQVDLSVPAESLKEIVQLSVDSWKEKLFNDFEAPVFRKYEEIRQVRDGLYHAGALYASMTGSGSTVFGIFPGPPSLPAYPTHYFVKIV